MLPGLLRGWLVIDATCGKRQYVCGCDQGAAGMADSSGGCNT
ncbi:Hypothetical protein RY67_71 [Bifidobacterium longum subsp. infantis]|uniref:Uncharacterized protein n=1 Tax=Bifidobacterium longum subsp. infantis TaxID=1682 RepID=A0A0M4M0Y9_BIFLI|nr:Hypothetical protein RY67_71 [Bifidobacterium longum subsp. infantis]